LDVDSETVQVIVMSRVPTFELESVYIDKVEVEESIVTYDGTASPFVYSIV
jgi:hypothetical protein